MGEQVAGNIQRIQIRMLQHHGRPTDTVMRCFASHLQTRGTRGGLIGFDGQYDTTFGRALKGREVGQYLLQHVIGVDITHHQEDHVLRDITILVESDHVRAIDALHDWQVADCGMADWVFGVDERLHGLVLHPLATRLAHFQLALDDFHFAKIFVFGNQRVLHTVGDQLNRQIRSTRRAIDEVRCHIGRRKGVCLAAHRIQQFLNLGFRPLGGRTECHKMFQHVADPRAQISALERAAGILHEASHGSDRCRMILLDEHGHAV